MSETRFIEPVVRFCGVITRHPESHDWAIETLSQQWGNVLLESPPIAFEAGGYYTSTMGAGLQKRLVALEGFQDPGGLADWKHQTNQWERDYAGQSEHAEQRPLNLDPGYLTQAKLVLATTKDRDHRLYLRDGMFAEVTLTYVGKRWNHHRWSYPSYRSEEVAQFASDCRQQLRKHLQATRAFRQPEA
ncbi:MAG: DUF4416 family protein [Rubripirellula sp.]|nr:DUF4416 family protein [Rubripirellula sp.]